MEVSSPPILPLPGVRYVHTNIVARDWRRLADFYATVFGCALVPPERDYAGPDLEKGTGVAGATLRGAHLRLPGHGSDGPTLEIYQYGAMPEPLPPLANRPGFAHIAFSVVDVVVAADTVVAHGGQRIGEVVTLTTADGRHVTWCYLGDPEGNLVELQSWS
jgi:predicted enzyme related to lactoylglutathione lyase